MKISVITPTCYRPQMFKEMCESLEATTQPDYFIEHVIIIDQDIKTYQIAVENNCPQINKVIDFSDKKRGALECWNLGLSLSSGDIIVPGGDDHLYHPKWLDYALETHEKKLNGYGVVGMNDLAYDENQVATMFLFDRSYCKNEMGGIFAPPHYRYLCIDLEWNDKAKMLGHYYRDMRAIIEHRHSAHGKRPFDKHDEGKDEKMYREDTATYMSRKANGFPIDYNGVI